MTPTKLSAFALGLQVFGTVCLVLDSTRTAVRLPKEGIRLGDPGAFASPIFQVVSPLGFLLLFAGFALQGLVMWRARSISPAPAPQPDPVRAVLDLEKLLEYHRHEDILFDRRLSALLVSTAFLIAGFAQFRDWPDFSLAITICVAGFVVAFVFWRTLGRAVDGLTWSNEEIRNAERPHPGLQIYTTRDARLKRYRAGNWWLGRVIPSVLVVLWLALGFFLVVKHAAQWRATLCGLTSAFN